jgi:hypothetical protein
MIEEIHSEITAGYRAAPSLSEGFFHNFARAGTIPAWHNGSPDVYCAAVSVAVAMGMDLLNF